MGTTEEGTEGGSEEEYRAGGVTGDVKLSTRNQLRSTNLNVKTCFWGAYSKQWGPIHWIDKMITGVRWIYPGYLPRPNKYWTWRCVVKYFSFIVKTALVLGFLFFSLFSTECSFKLSVVTQRFSALRDYRDRPSGQRLQKETEIG